MKVLMSPGRTCKLSNNLYINIICNEISNFCINISHWKPYIFFQKGDIFHVHWPELVPSLYYDREKKFIAPIIEYNFWNTIKKIKSSGGRLLWTVHNLHPHSSQVRNSKRWIDFRSKFYDEVDTLIFLTPSSRLQLINMYPSLRYKKWGVAHHPHYKNVNCPISSIDYRSVFGISRNTIVFGIIGSLNVEKGILKVLDSFSRCRPRNAVLFLAGKCCHDVLVEISAAQAAGVPIISLLRNISNQEVVDFYNMIDVSVFSSEEHLNSGTVMHSLSCNVPVRLYKSPTNEYISDKVGCHWISFIQNDIFEDSFLNNMDAIRSCKNKECFLDDFDPSYVARQHIQIYKI